MKTAIQQLESLFFKLSATYAICGDDPKRSGQRKKALKTFLDGVFELEDSTDREALMLQRLKEFRSRVGTGPAGGQVRANLDSIVRETYGNDFENMDWPKGVFDE